MTLIRMLLFSRQLNNNCHTAVIRVPTYLEYLENLESGLKKFHAWKNHGILFQLSAIFLISE